MPSTKIELYRLNVANGTFTKQAIITNYTNLSYSEVLNGIGECTFNLNILDKSLTQSNFLPYITQIAIKDNNKIVWVGTYSNYEGNINHIDGVVTIRGYSYLHHLMSRITNKTTYYTQIEQAQILRNLINLAQGRTNGNLGITTNSENTGVIRNRIYEYKTIGEAFIQMSEVINGCDFEFIPIQNGANNLQNINLVIYNKRKGGFRSDLPPLKVGSLDNIANVGYSFDGNLYNHIIAEGAGGQDTLISTQDNTPSQIGYTRREYFLPLKDISEQATLNEQTNTFLNFNSIPRHKINLQIKPNSNINSDTFGLGDTLNVRIKASDLHPEAGDLINFVGTCRVVEIKSIYDDNCIKTIIPKVIYNN